MICATRYEDRGNFVDVYITAINFRSRDFGIPTLEELGDNCLEDLTDYEKLEDSFQLLEGRETKDHNVHFSFYFDGRKDDWSIRVEKLIQQTYDIRVAWNCLGY